jgi:hypothetical protein
MNMNYLADFIKMTKNEYISYELLEGLDARYKNELYDRIIFLTENLKYYGRTKVDAATLLQVMSELSCIKSVLEMQVNINVLTDAKDKEKRYLQARGAVPYGKKLRFSGSYYIGPERSYLGGKDNPDVKQKGRTEVVKRVLEGLKSLLGL